VLDPLGIGARTPKFGSDRRPHRIGHHPREHTARSHELHEWLDRVAEMTGREQPAAIDASYDAGANGSDRVRSATTRCR
jgi:hypothetical protein